MSSLERHYKKYNNLLTVATCCSEGFGCERLSLLEVIALGFIIYLVYQHFMKLVQFILLRHGLGRKKDGWGVNGDEVQDLKRNSSSIGNKELVVLVQKGASKVHY